MRARRIVRAYIGLGSNLGDPARTLASAVEAIAELPGLWVAGVSRLYATVPWGVTDQPEFRNAAVAVDIRYDDRASRGRGPQHARPAQDDRTSRRPSPATALGSP